MTEVPNQSPNTNAQFNNNSLGLTFQAHRSPAPPIVNPYAANWCDTNQTLNNDSETLKAFSLHGLFQQLASTIAPPCQTASSDIQWRWHRSFRAHQQPHLYRKQTKPAHHRLGLGLLQWSWWVDDTCRSNNGLRKEVQRSGLVGSWCRWWYSLSWVQVVVTTALGSSWSSWLPSIS